MSLHHHSAFQNNEAELRKGLSDTAKKALDQKVLGFLELLLMLRKTDIEALQIHHQALQNICSIHLAVVPMTLKAFWTSDGQADYRTHSEPAFHSAQMSLCLAKVSRLLMLRRDVDGASMADQHVRVRPWQKPKTAWQPAAKPQSRNRRMHHRKVAWLTEACSDAMLCQVQLLKLQPRLGHTLMQQTKFYPFFLDFHHHQSPAYQVVVWGLHVDADPPVA